MSDDWNISRSWHEEMDRKELVARARRRRDRQLLDLPAPRQPLAARARRERALRARSAATRDATEVLREWAQRDRHRPAPGTRWSFCRDIGGMRAIFMDSRAGRVLTEERRSMVDDEEWDWIVEHAERRLRPPADRDHRALPALARLPPPRGLERAALRRRLGRPGRARRARSCAARSTSTTGPRSSTPSQRLRELLEEVGSGRRGKAPASIVVLSGDVHHAYLGEVAFKPGAESARAPSTRRSARPTATRSTRKSGGSCGPASRARSPRSRAAWPGSPAPPTRASAGARSRARYFDNQVGDRSASTAAKPRSRLDKTVAGEEDERALEKTFERRLT